MDESYSIVLAGVGSCGCMMLGRLHEDWTDAPEMAVLHTNRRVLDLCGGLAAVALGPGVTQGLSTGGDPVLGRRAAEESLDAIRPVFAGADLVLVLSGLGGGTGSGAMPVVCRAAREAGATVLAFCTLPFFFEGLRKRRLAEEALADIRRECDAIIVLPNERLVSQADTEVGMMSAFRLGDRLIGEHLRVLWKTLGRPGALSVDMSDLRALTSAAGTTLVMATGEGRGPGKAGAALNAIDASPLLEHGAVLSSARSLLVSVLGGPDLSLAELNEVVTGITAKAAPDVDLRVGAVADPEFEGRLLVGVMASEHRLAPVETAPAPAETPPVDGETPVKPAGRGRAVRARKAGTATVQPELDIAGQGQGRFAGSEATLIDGQNLDVPTFIRRGIRLSTSITV